MLNFCGIVVAILKMAIGRNFSMSGHHYLPTYTILMISYNVEILPPICYAVFWQPYDSIVTTTPFEPLKISLWPQWPQSWKLKDQLETYIYNSTKFHEILSSSSWDLPWTSLCATERNKGE